MFLGQDFDSTLVPLPGPQSSSDVYLFPYAYQSSPTVGGGQPSASVPTWLYVAGAIAAGLLLISARKAVAG
jgi:hypothetical protein